MKIPANAQDVSHDKTLSSETIHSCNSHYSTRMHNYLYNNVSGGECAVGDSCGQQIWDTGIMYVTNLY